MQIVRYDTELEDEVIKSIYIQIRKYRLLGSLGQSNWQTKGRDRLIPIWISKKGLFIYRIAIRFTVISTTTE